MSSKLFKPAQLGNLQLQHRIVHAPLTRIRTTPTAAPLPDVVKEYYAQRAGTPGTFLITEATLISTRYGGFPGFPGIWSQEQIDAWKEIATAVHEKKSSVFLQIVATGRTADAAALKATDPTYDVVAPSAIPLTDAASTPRAMTIPEIQSAIRDFALAAKNAVFLAGFDGVEIHGAMGFLVDQFIQDVSNQRGDEYGGSIEGRSKFALDVVGALVDAIGEERTAIRLSPWNTYQDMGMEDPIPQFSHLVNELKTRYPKLAYIHLVEPRVLASEDIEVKDGQSNDFIRKLWSPKLLLSAGGYNLENATQLVEENDNELVVFGRWFLSNPDLPERFRKNLPLNQYDRSTFYLYGDATGKGYTDYPFIDAN